MTHSHDNLILSINSGSSSLKIVLFLMGKKEMMELSARIERIGLSAGHFQIRDGKGQILAEEAHVFAAQQALHHRAVCNRATRRGECDAAMERT
jgi:acetate kinase